MIKTVLRALSNKEDLLLRIAVAFPMLWAGVRQIMNPTDWIGFVPSWIGSIINPDLFLIAHAFTNLIVGLGLLLGFWRILFSAAATAMFVSILIFYGIDDVTFRDVGLAIAAFILLSQSLRRHSQYH